MSDTLYISRCPVTGRTATPVRHTTHWFSDPCSSEDVAAEALRRHLDAHKHSDLIDFAMTGLSTERYQRLAEKG